MMNKSSSRLIAWLMALVMILNIAPISALADTIIPSDPQENPTIPSEITVNYIGEGNWSGDKTRTGNDDTPSSSQFAFYDTYHYQLAGWSTSSEYNGSNGALFEPGSKIDFSNRNVIVADDKTITLYAVPKYRVDFGLNGGTWNDSYDSASMTQYVTQGSQLTRPNPDPVKSDAFGFDKWELNGSEYDFSTPVTSFFNLTAQYSYGGIKEDLYNLAVINYKNSKKWYRLRKTSITILTNQTASKYVADLKDKGNQKELNASDYIVENYDFANEIIYFPDDKQEYYFQGNLTADELDPEKNYYTVQYEHNNGQVSDHQVIVAAKNKIGGGAGWLIPEGEERYKEGDRDCFKRNFVITLNNKANRQYTVKFIGANDNVLDKKTLKYGTIPSTSKTPTKRDTAQYTYEFAGWEPEIVSVAGNATYTAKFNEIPKEYTITWKDENGNTIDETQVVYGEVPTHADPAKDSDEKFNYLFSGWTPSIVPVTGKATYIAQFDKELIDSEEQDLYNFLKVGNITADYYRLKKQTIKGAPIDEVPNGIVDKDKYPYTFPDGEYDFTNAKFKYEGETYVYSEVPIDDYYFEVKPLKVEVWDYLHGKDGAQKHTEWLNNPDGWADGGVDSWGNIDNKTRVYHRNYEAILHAPTTIKHKVTYVYEGDVPTGLTLPAEEKYAEGADVTIADEPAAVDGYTFSGWKIGEEDAESFTMGDAEVTITGTWVRNEAPYTIHHYLKGTTTQVKADETGNAPEGSTISAILATTYSEKNLTVADENPTTSITITDGENVLTIYYTLPLTIEAKTDSRTYNSQPLNGSYTITGALNNDVAGIETALGAVPSITNVSESPKSYLTETEQANITGIPSYYNVTYIPGTLTVNKASLPITISGDKQEFTYDGTAKTASGYTATSTSTLLDTGKISFSGTSSVTETVAGTYAMGLAADQFGYDDANVEATFSVADGELKINKAALAITITGDKQEYTYDGTAKTATGYTARSESTLFDASKIVFSGTSSVTETEAGTYAMGLAAGQFSYDDASFENVIFNVTDGELKINKATLTITITGDKKEYDYNGAEQTASGYTARSESTLFDESKIVFSGTRSVTKTNAGTYPMGLAADQFSYNDENIENATFSVTDGELKIKPIDVTVTIIGANNTTDYDGESHSVNGYTATATSTLYDVNHDFTFSGTASATRTDAGTTDMGLAASQFTNTNTNFNVTFEVTDGYQTINPIDVTVIITGANNTADYNGAIHTVSGYTATATSTLYDVDHDFTFSGTASATRTDAGTTNMGLVKDQFTNTNTNFNTTFEVTDGYQTINPINVTVTITGANNTTAYDGAAHTVTGYTATANTALYDVTKDFSFTGTTSATRTDAGTTNMGLAASQFTNTNGNFGTVTFSITDGYQTINPIDVTVTITGHNNSTTYDGAEHAVAGYDVAISNDLYQAKDFTFNGTAEAKQTDEGTTNMGLAAEQFANTNDNFGTVTFTVTDGYQTIVPVEEVIVTITGHNNTTSYDGTEHRVESYDVQISDPLYTVADFTFSGTSAAARTDAGTTNMGLAESQFRNTNKNFKNVTFSVTDGYQTINPIDATVTITGHHATADYDGDEHSVSGYDVEISNPLYSEADFTFSGTGTAAQTNAGTTYMDLAADQFTNTNTNFANVTFNVTDGYQAITPISATVTITGHFAVGDYDGEEHSISGYDVEISNPLYTQADFIFSGNTTAARTNAGTTNMGLADNQFTNSNTNFTNVTFNVTDGYQTISPIEATVTITGHHATSDYDGEEHGVNGYEVEISNTLYTEADFTFNGSAAAARTDAGTTGMGLAAGQFSNTNNNFRTVTFEVTDGYQTISPIDTTVTIVGANNATDYDGNEHSVSGYTATANSALYDVEHDFTFSGTSEAARTAAGTTNMGLAEEQFTNTNENFGTVTFEVTDGYQTVSPIDVNVSITGHNNTAVYDGAEHTVTGYDVEISNPLYKEADFAFSGTASAAQTAVGSQNMGLAAGQFTNTNTNFGTVTFNVADGYQTITKKDVTVTITGHTASANYDGGEHTVAGYDVDIDSTLYTEADFAFSGTASTARTDAGTANIGLTAEQFTNNNDNFDVTFSVTDGGLTINPIDAVITITGVNNTAPFDGEEHSVSGYTAAASTNLYDVDSNISFTGTAAAARTDAGTEKMGLAADQFANTNPNFANVTFQVTDGYQTISPIDVTVTITGHNNSTTYDGEEHSVSGFDSAFSNALYTAADFTFSGTAEAARTDAGTTNMDLAADQFANTNNNFGTVTFNVTDGYQTVTALEEVVVTITGHQNTTDYDGGEHSVSGYDVSISNPLYTEADFTFSSTASATRIDAGTTNMGLTADQFVNTNGNFADVTFNVTDGYQTIQKINAAVTITGHNGTAAYNGTEHSVTGYDVAISPALYTEDDFTFSGTAEVKGTDADEYLMGLAAGQFANTNDNFETVTFNVTDGKLVVTPISAKVTITGHKDSKPYDGTALSVTGYDVAIDSELYTENDFTFGGTAAASQTNAGTAKMKLAADQFANRNSNFANVTFDVTDGEVTITPIDVTVTITGDHAENEFDGETHTVTGYDVEIGNDLYTAADFSFSGSNSASRKDVGTTNMGLASSQFSNINNNFGTVTFNVTDGTQTITPKAVTVTALEAGKTYGTPDPALTASVNGTIGNDQVVYEVKREAGENAGNYAITASGDATQGNYTVTYSGNTFTISTSDALALTAGGYSGVYDGTAHAVTASADVTDGTTIEYSTNNGETWSLDAPSIINVGSFDVQVRATNSNYNTKTANVTLTVTPKAVTVTANNGSKVYGGDDPEEFTAEVNGTLGEDTVDYSVARVSGEDVGHYAVTATGEAAQGNYSVTFVPSDFEIIKADTTLAVSGYTGIYDAQSHGLTVTPAVSEGTTITYSLDNGVTWTNEAPSITDVGTTVVKVKATNPNYNDVIETGTLTVTPKAVTVTGNNGSKIYNSADPATFTATVEGTLGSDTVTYTVSRAAGDNVGHYAVIPTGNVLQGNYSVTYINGDFEITKKAMTISVTGHKSTQTYSGSELSVTGYDLNSEDELYSADKVIFSGKAEVKGTAVNAYAMGLTAEQFNYNDSNIDATFAVEDGGLTISQAEVVVTIAGNKESKVYNGEEQKTEGYTVSINNPLYTEADFTFSGEAVAKGTTVDSYPMGLTDERFTNNNANFQVAFEVTDGELTITKAPVTVTITGNSSSPIYTGSEQQVEGYTVSINDPLYTEDSFAFSGETVVKGTDAGTYPMGLTADRFTNNNANFDVTFSVTDGTLTIGKRAVSLTSADDSKAYDGNALTNNTVTIGDDGFAEGEGAVYTFTGSQTDVGSSANAFAYTLDEGTNTNNYDITKTEGTLTVSAITDKVTVTITENSGSAQYDGTEKTVSGYRVAIDNALYTEASFTFKGDATVTGTDAGIYPMNLSADDFENTSANFTNVEFVIVDGSLEISKRSVTLTSADASKTYGGTALTNETVTVSGDGFAAGEGATYEFSGSRTDAGSSKNAFSYTLNEGTKADNYDITTVEGTLTVNPAAITIKADNKTKIYDNGTDTDPELTATVNGAVNGDTVNYTLVREAGQDAGEYAITVTAGENPNYTVSVEPGVFKIKPLTGVIVTVTEHSDEVDYSGEEHTVTGYDVAISNPLYVENNFIFNGDATVKGTNAGSYAMELKAADFTNTNKNFANVTFQITDGLLTIKPIDVTVTITEHSDEADYDGAEHTVTGYDVAISNPLYTKEDFTFIGNATVAGTDAGSYDMELSADDFVNTNANFASATFEITDGQLVINPIAATVTIVGAANTTNYNGAEHTVTGYTTTASTDLYDVSKDFTFSGSAEAKRTNAGTTNMGLATEQFENTNNNFSTVTFNVTDGYQTVNPINAVVTIVGTSSTLTYDGGEHSVSGYTATADTDLYNVNSDFTFNGTAEAARTDEGRTDMGLAAEQFENTNGNFSTVTFNVTDGYQAIAPIDEVVVTITGHSNTTAYDGSEHSVSGYDVEISNDLYKEADFTFSGTAEAARTDAGTANMGLAAEQFANTNSNFAKVTFNVTDGYQAISPIDATVTIVGANDTADYDGGEHTVTGYTATADTALYDVENDFTFSGTASASRTDAGTTNMGLAAEQFENTNGNFSTVTFNVTDGYQTISPIDATVTIVGANDTTDYDGEAHNVSGYTATASTDLYDVKNDITFNGTAEAGRTDAGTTSMGLADSQFANTNENFRSVTFNVTDGYQTIDKIDATVTVVGANNTIDYDGEAHNVSGYTATASTDLYDVDSDFTFSGSAAAGRTDAGTTNMGLAAEQFTNTNTNFETVTFNVTDGYQTVNKLAVTVTAENKSRTNRMKDEDPELTATVTGLVDGEAESIIGYELSKAMVNADGSVEYPNPGEYTITVSGPAEITNYIITYENAVLTVTDGTDPLYNIAKVMIDGKTLGWFRLEKSKVLTAYPLEHYIEGATDHRDYIVPKDEWKADDYSFGDISVDGKTYKYWDVKNNGQIPVDDTGDYYTAEYLNFVAVWEKIGGSTGWLPVDSTEYDDPNETSGFHRNYTIKLYNGTRENEPLYNLVTTGKDLNHGPWYRLKAETIEGVRPATYYSKNTNFYVGSQYDGVAPVPTAFDFSGYVIPQNNIEYRYIDDVAQEELDNDTADYFTAEYGRLIVKKTNELTATFLKEEDRYQIASNTSVYDRDYIASLHTAANSVYTIHHYLLGTDISVAPDQTGIGVIGSSLTAAESVERIEGFETAVYNSQTEAVIIGHNATENEITVYYTVPLNIKADNKAKVYDNNADTDPEMTATVTGTIGTDSINYELEREAGQSAGNYTISVKDIEVPGYYTVTTETGEFNITSLDGVIITITEHSGSEKYDGTEHTVTGYDVASSNELYTTADFSFSGNDSVSGTDAGSYAMELKADDFANTNDNFEDVTFVIVDGSLEIGRRSVTLTSADGEKVYDKTALTNDTVTVSGDGFIEGEGATYSVTGNQTVVGNSANGFTYTLNDNTKADNYEITTANGTLTVNAYAEPVVVTITEHSGEVKYDGQAHEVTGYDVSISDPLYEVSDFSFSGTASASGTDAGTYNMELVPANFTNTNTNFTNVTFEIVDGQLAITKRNVTLTSATDEKVYDRTALTNNTVAVTGDGFATGEGATYSVTGSQTAVGESANGFTYTLNDNTKADNYEITTANGTLTVTPYTNAVTVTITEHSGEVKYDGQAHEVTGYDVSISDPLYKVTDFTFNGDDSMSGTDAGTYDMNLAAADFTNTNTNFTNVTFTIVDGQLAITKRNVTLTSATDSKQYDGNVLTNDTVTVTSDGFVENEGATYSVTGSQLVVGSSENEFTYTLNEGTKADNYTITMANGTLTVINRDAQYQIEVEAVSGTEQYDGNEHTLSGLVATEFEVEGNTYTVEGLSATATGTDAGSYTLNVVGTPVVKDSAGNDVTAQFAVSTKSGTLTITKRNVTLTSATDEKTYDRTALTNNTVAVTGDGFATGEGATYSVTGSQLAVGDSANGFTYTLNDNTKADNYEITTVDGTLTVTAYTEPVVVTITEHSGEVKYDGQAHAVTGYDVSISDPLYKVSDFSFTGTASVSGTDAGTYDMNLAEANFTNTNTNFTNVTFEIEEGQLAITKRNVMLTSATDEKVYDRTALTNNTVAVTGDGFATGEGATYSVTGSQLAVGDSANGFTYTLNDNTKADNYEITTVDGTLTVTAYDEPVVVTITEHSGEVKYDGQAHAVTGYDVNISDPLYKVSDFSFSGTASASGTDAGTYNMELVPANFTNTNTNFTNVTFEIVDGQLAITKRNVTLTSATDGKTYDGTALTNNNVTVSGDGFVTGEGATYDVTGTIMDPGTESNAFTYTLNEGTLADNYSITTMPGTLTINKVTTEIVITAASDSKTYDGSALTNNGYTYTKDVLAEGDVLTATVEGIITNVGKAANVVTGYQVMRGETDVTANYTFGESVDGQLAITKRNVTLTSATDGKTYDGTALTNNNVTVSGDGFVTGEGATYDVTGTIMDPGTESNAFTYTLNEGTLADNYSITTVPGTLTINKVTTEIAITAASDSKTYDGSALTNNGYTYTEGVLATGDVLTATVEGTITNVGTATNVVTGYQVMRGETDVTANYTFGESVDGELEIIKRPVTFSAVSETKEYTGSTITIDGLNVTPTTTGNGLVEGHTHNVTFSASGIEANTTYDGTITAADAVVIVAGEDNVTANYDITVENGALTIEQTEAELTVALESADYVYDAAAHNLTVAATTNALSGETTIEYSADGENWTEDLSSITATNVADSLTIQVRATNPNYSNEATNNALLTINPKDIVLTVDDQEKTYGDDDPEFTASYREGDLEGNDNVPYSLTRETGDTVGTYTINASASDPNYTISIIPAKLTINPKKITITADGKTTIYGEADPILTATTVGLVGSDYIATRLSREAGNDIGTYVINVDAISDPNYEITTETGILTIEPRPVVVTAEDQVKVYGDTDPILTVTVTGLATGESADLISYTLNRTTGEDVGDYKIEATGEATQGNYSVTYVPATLTIAPENTVIVTITANSGTYKYDGTEKDLSGYSVATNNPLYTEADFTFSGNNTLKGKNVGTYETAMKATDFANANPNFENVLFKVNNGTLVITKRSITLTSASDEKVYDGSVLTNNTVTPVGDGFANGEGANITVVGRQTEVGESDNTFTYSMMSGTQAGNYEITPIFGKLKVTAPEAKTDDATPTPTPTPASDATPTPAPEETTSDETATPAPGATATPAPTTGTSSGTGSDSATGSSTTPTSTPASTSTNDTDDNDNVVEKHKLTIRYQYEDGTFIRKYENEYAEGNPYSVTSDKLAGYTADQKVVTGTMGKTNIDATVTYSRETYRLTVKFISMGSDTRVADPVTLDLRGGDNYSVFVPAVEGYTALQDKVIGVMPNSDRTITVLMMPEGGIKSLGGTQTPIIIEDFGTPLGVAESIPGGGEGIE